MNTTSDEQVIYPTIQELELRNSLVLVADEDVRTLIQKDRDYGSSWKKRGGVGAYMMLARKWDRIENLVKKNGYDIFRACLENVGDIKDDLADLRRYLMLVESEVRRLENEPVPEDSELPEEFSGGELKESSIQEHVDAARTEEAEVEAQNMTEYAASKRDEVQ